MWPQSLQAQLAVRLSLVFLAAAALAVAALVWQGSITADTYHNDKLLARATEIARYVVPVAGGRIRVDLPPKLKQRYDEARAANLYAVRLGNGYTIASGTEFAAFAERAPAAAEKPRYISLEDFGKSGNDFYGVTMRATTAAGPASITVARVSDADEVAEALLWEFVHKVAWLVPLFAAIMLAIAIWSIRRGLHAVSAVSVRAATIDADTIGERLPTAGLPTELVPLVTAVNSAFDRLEKGFAVQRQFTANAAHELRTPLTMLTAGLDELGADASVEKLRGDAARMNRLVDQLLRVARLDAMPMNLKDAVNLNEIATDVVAYLAPWAIARRRELGLEVPEHPVLVKGNAAAIADALRNVIENAVRHTPEHTEVRIAVGADGSVTIDDSGTGIPATDRPHIFDRFWRGKDTGSPGAGLGLSIVAEIVRMHGGDIDVGDAPGGGASFTLKFRPA
ncbi:MAG: HAMP domain-containing histidine kinase [Alphaproteobacteria bacterium]|nr:HAMP domain-containing histidine kinase [Alphaproteobacteria bacterium]